MATNLPTPPRTHPSSIPHDIPLSSPLAGPSKRRRSASPLSLPIGSRKKLKHDKKYTSASNSQATASSSHDVIDLTMDTDEELKALSGKGKKRAKGKKPLKMVSFGKDYFELFDSDEDHSYA
jgi:hypothetical protein